MNIGIQKVAMSGLISLFRSSLWLFGKEVTTNFFPFFLPLVV